MCSEWLSVVSSSRKIICIVDRMAHCMIFICILCMCVCRCVLEPARGYVCNYSVVCVLQGKHRPLVEASAQGHVGLVNILLRYKADIDATGKVCITYIMAWYEKVCVYV